MKKLLHRIPVLAAVLLLVAALGYGYHRGHNARAPWTFVRVEPTAFGPFEDLQTVAYSIDCSARGIDPYKVSCEPLQRPLSYPPIWFSLRYLGFNSTHILALGWISFAVVCVAYILIFLTRSAFTSAVAFCAVLFSRPVVLAMERGNVDELIFSAIVFSCALAAFLPWRSRKWLIAGTVIVLTCLKIYPFVTALRLLQSRRSFWGMLTVVMLSVGALFATAGRHVHDFIAFSDISTFASFGIVPFIEALGRIVHKDLHGWVLQHIGLEQAVACCMFLCAAVAGILFRDRFGRYVPSLEVETFRGALAVSCVAVYCFAFIGRSSYNYRLIFLSGVISFLLVAYDSGYKTVLPWVLLLLLYVVLPGRLVVAHEILDGATYLWFSAWIGKFAFDAWNGTDGRRVLDAI